MSTQYLRPSKDESFMQIAESVSMRSTCLRRRYGAVIVSKDGRIVSTGYNGAPRHRANCTDLNSCLRDELGVKPGTHYELCRAVHAEANAIINGNPLDIMGGTLYLCGTDAATNKPSKYISPCAMCQRLILNAQISRVVMRDENLNLVEADPLAWDDDSALLMEHRRNQQAISGEDLSHANIDTTPTVKLPQGGCCGGGCCGGEEVANTTSLEESTNNNEQLGLDSCGDFGKGSPCSSEADDDKANKDDDCSCHHCTCGKH